VQRADGKPPSPLEATFGASQIMQGALMRTRLRQAGDRVIVIEAQTDGVAGLDFFAAKRIFAANEGLRERIQAVVTQV
jgi:hypothetical protein